jgi:ankyrin repeat protein
VNGSTGTGPTPLTGAVDDGSTELVKFLLEAGADPNIPNQVTMSPADPKKKTTMSPALALLCIYLMLRGLPISPPHTYGWVVIY